MKTFAIIGKTDLYYANRDINFNGKSEVVFVKNLSLKEAQQKLLDMFNKDYEHEIGGCINWAVARRKKKYSTSSFKDGTRSYVFDLRYYRIEEETIEIKEKFGL